MPPAGDPLSCPLNNSRVQHASPPPRRYGKASSAQGKAANKAKVDAPEPLAGKGRDLISALNDKIESE